VSLREIDAVLTLQPHRHPDLQLVDAANPVEVEDYANTVNRVDLPRAMKLFAGGATFILNRLDEYCPAVHALCTALETELGILVQANMYLTPAGAQGFPVHYDNHDVIIVQCEGRKDWRLFGTPQALPMRGERFERGQHQPGEKTLQLVLEPGDALYVPRGQMHEAAAAGDGCSLHVTIGFHAVRWSEVIIEALAGHAAEDLDLRRGLPLGALVGKVPEEELLAGVRERVGRLVEALRWDKVRERVVTQFVDEHRERLEGLLLDVTSPLDEGTVFAPREGLMVTRRQEGDKCHLSVNGRETRWPDYVYDTLGEVFSRPRFTLGDLGDALDVKGRSTLLRRLILEGAVRVARER
jgi:ribosomal protein L16 Arg81 hydroxylase